jgi:hypothetical protein
MSFQQALLDAAIAGISFCMSTRFCGARGLFAGEGEGLQMSRLTGPCRSFSADTQVLMADGTTRPFDEVKVGDEVFATDPETGERAARRVTNLWIHTDTMQGLLVNGQTITTTEDHIYWNATDRKWERADQLDVGDLLMTPTGAGAPVGGLTAGASTATAYNLTVEGIHTYYVLAGNTPVLVHNEGGYSPGDIDAVQHHLSSLDPFGPNDEMIARIRTNISNGSPLTGAQTNFMEHELLESRLMGGGMSYDAAHAQALGVHPPGMNYDVDIIEREPLFGPWWRRQNGLPPRGC